jgi:RNA polymerase sigma-70 factor (ECF subfamily)
MTAMIAATTKGCRRRRPSGVEELSTPLQREPLHAAGRAPRRALLGGVSLSIASQHAIARAYAADRAYVRACLRRHGLGLDGLDDGVHDVFAVVLRRIDDFDASRSMRHWLAGIARFVAANHRRREGRRSAIVRGGDDEGAELPALDLRLDLAAGARALAADERTALALALAQGHTAGEIAEHLRVPLSTAQWWIRSARTQLRAAL